MAMNNQYDSSMSTETIANNPNISNQQFPNDILEQSISSSKPRVFGSVAVTNSENVLFGDKHINVYNGPVSINQIISGVGNASYVQTDDEKHKDTRTNDMKQECVDNNKKIKIQLWHKLTASVVSIFVVGGISGLIYVKLKKETISDKSYEFNLTSVAANDLFIAPNHLRIVSRTEWLAQPPLPGVDPIVQPVPWVIIAHTATAPCYNQSACVLQVRFIQDFHVSSRGWSDIAYNFLVGGDGSAYYGRGWDYIAAHTKGYNKYSIGIAFIGTFTHEEPPVAQVEACKKLINLGVELGKIAKDYKLFAHRQLMSTVSPGDKVYEIISKWPHFVKNYTLDLIPKY